MRLAGGVELIATDGGQILLGPNCSLSRGVSIVAQGGRIVVGANTFIGPWSTLTAKRSVSLGDDCLVAERVSIRDQNHATAGIPGVLIREAGYDIQPVEIGNDVWIGAGAVVLKGVTVGRGAVIAANAVAVRDVAALEVVGGIPAVTISTRTPSRV